jgi:hypothetical protein
LEKAALEQEREKIRELHHRQQQSLKCLQTLESKLSKFALDDEETLQGSSTPSRVPTLELMFNTQTAKPPTPQNTDAQTDIGSVTAYPTSTDDSEISESESTMTDDDDEHLSLEELAKAARHVQKLLKRITTLQKTYDSNHKSKLHKKRRVHKIYQRFCRKWESNIVTVPTNPPKVPELLKHLSGCSSEKENLTSTSLESVTVTAASNSTQASQHDPWDGQGPYRPVMYPRSGGVISDAVTESRSYENDFAIDWEAVFPSRISDESSNTAIQQAPATTPPAVPEPSSDTKMYSYPRHRSQSQLPDIPVTRSHPDAMEGTHPIKQAQQQMQQQSMYPPPIWMDRDSQTPNSFSHVSLSTHYQSAPEPAQASSVGLPLVSEMNEAPASQQAQRENVPSQMNKSSTTAFLDTSVELQNHPQMDDAQPQMDWDLIIHGDDREPIASSVGLSPAQSSAGGHPSNLGWVSYYPNVRPSRSSTISEPVRIRGRTKGLSAEQRSHAALMRIIGACDSCMKRKEKCDPSTPCRSCVAHFKDDLVNHPCRGRRHWNTLDASMRDPFQLKTMKRKNVKGLALSVPPPKSAPSAGHAQILGGIANDEKQDALETGVDFHLDRAHSTNTNTANVPLGTDASIMGATRRTSSNASSVAPQERGPGYSTIRRYKISNHALEEDKIEQEMHLVERSDSSKLCERRPTKDYNVEREVREYRIERSVDPLPTPSITREYRIAEDYELDAPVRTGGYELERYSKDTEYYRHHQHQPQSISTQNEAPAPIVIREEAIAPIIICEGHPDTVKQSPSRDAFDRRSGPKDELALVEYGYDPIFRSRPSRSRDTSREGSYSTHDSQVRSRSRNRYMAETAVVKGAASMAAHETAKRRELGKHQGSKDHEREPLESHVSDDRCDRAAQVGLASAAVAGLIHRRRSRSLGSRHRSRSRTGQRVPISTAGLVGAAVAGLYEKHKMKQETRALSRSSGLRTKEQEGGRNFHVDDDITYNYMESDTRASGSSTRRHVATEALAGIAASQTVRHHQKTETEAEEGNAGKVLGYGQLAAVSDIDFDGCDNWNRSQSFTRTRSVSSERGRKRRRSRSRPRESESSRQALGTIASIAGIGVLAYAAGRKEVESNSTPPRRQSLKRRRSPSHIQELSTNTAKLNYAESLGSPLSDRFEPDTEHKSKRRRTTPAPHENHAPAIPIAPSYNLNDFRTAIVETSTGKTSSEATSHHAKSAWEMINAANYVHAQQQKDSFDRKDFDTDHRSKKIIRNSAGSGLHKPSSPLTDGWRKQGQRLMRNKNSRSGSRSVTDEKPVDEKSKNTPAQFASELEIGLDVEGEERDIVDVLLEAWTVPMY